jgi:hypothetical protein
VESAELDVESPDPAVVAAVVVASDPEPVVAGALESEAVVEGAAEPLGALAVESAVVPALESPASAGVEAVVLASAVEESDAENQPRPFDVSLESAAVPVEVSAGVDGVVGVDGVDGVVDVDGVVSVEGGVAVCVGGAGVVVAGSATG